MPEYNRCNRGHILVEVYNPADNAYYWDCPICIRQNREDAWMANEAEHRASSAGERWLIDYLSMYE